MRAFFLFLLLAACTVPPETPVKEDPPKETGVAEAPPPEAPAPPKPKPKPPPVIKAVEPPPKPPCPAPVNPKKRILQELDCLIEETKTKP